MLQLSLRKGNKDSKLDKTIKDIAPINPPAPVCKKNFLVFIRIICVFLFSWKICDYSWKWRKSRWPLSWMSPRRGTAKRNAVLNRSAKFSLDEQGTVPEFETVPELKPWQAAWAKRVSRRKPQGEFVPSDSPREGPCFYSGTLPCVVLSATHHLFAKFRSGFSLLHQIRVFCHFSGHKILFGKFVALCEGNKGQQYEVIYNRRFFSSKKYRFLVAFLFGHDNHMVRKLCL